MKTISGKVVLDKSLIGAALLGGMTVEQGAAVLMGSFDEELTCLAAFKNQGMFIEEYTIGEAELAFLEKVKKMLKNDFQNIFKLAEEEDLKNLKRKAEEAVKKMNQPSEHGTVEELSIRTGLSKSVIRKHKREGTLSELLSEKEMS